MIRRDAIRFIITQCGGVPAIKILPDHGEFPLEGRFKTVARHHHREVISITSPEPFGGVAAFAEAAAIGFWGRAPVDESEAVNHCVHHRSPRRCRGWEFAGSRSDYRSRLALPGRPGSATSIHGRGLGGCAPTPASAPGSPGRWSGSRGASADGRRSAASGRRGLRGGNDGPFACSSKNARGRGHVVKR